MKKFFDNNKAVAETKILTKITLSDVKNAPQRYESFNESVSWSCATQEDFAKVYDRIINRIERTRKEQKAPNIDVTIALSGKLKGKDVNQIFKNAESYRNFLEKNALISHPKLKLR